jgi:hypothetical protein
MRIGSLSYRYLVMAFVLFGLLPNEVVGFSQEQSDGAKDRAVFEITTRYWGMHAGSCRQTLNVRLYADGRIEYEECQKDKSAPTRETYSVIRKEAKVQEKEITELVEFIEQSGFLKSEGPVHSGLSISDAGWVSTLIYCGDNREKRVEIQNYDPESKHIPVWLHKIMEKALGLIPTRK